MSELHKSLIIIGLLLIVAVILFNRWQERKFRKQQEKMFRNDRQDVLFDESPQRAGNERIEPSFHHSVLIAEEEAFPEKLHETTVTDSSFTHATGNYESTANIAVPIEEIKPRQLIDEAIDLIGLIHVGKPVSADSVKGLIARAHTFSKPVHWEAMAAGRWMEIASGGQYTELKIALQLADRRGPATSEEISHFIALVKQFAVELDGAAQTEMEESAAARATDLDGFCAEVDVEIGVNLVARDHAMPATKLRALAESAGLKLNNDGVFHFYDDHGLPVFTLRNSEPRPFMPDHVKNISTHGITLLLDVPRVARGVAVFDQMLELGRHIAHALGGEVVDDNGKPLTDAGADTIRRELQVIYRAMEDYEISAGSAVALRLFS